jgi:hypothetical protein
VAFAILQLFAFYTARTVWGNRTYGYLTVGLIVCQMTPWLGTGGLFDFRMDFIAYCLFGVWVCAALRSNLFRDWRWAVAAGFIGNPAIRDAS